MHISGYATVPKSKNNNSQNKHSRPQTTRLPVPKNVQEQNRNQSYKDHMLDTNKRKWYPQKKRGNGETEHYNTKDLANLFNLYVPLF